MIDNDELAKLIHANVDGDYPGLESYVVRALFPVEADGSGLRKRIEEIKKEVSDAIENGARIIVLSDRIS